MDETWDLDANDDWSFDDSLDLLTVGEPEAQMTQAGEPRSMRTQKNAESGHPATEPLVDREMKTKEERQEVTSLEEKREARNVEGSQKETNVEKRNENIEAINAQKEEDSEHDAKTETVEPRASQSKDSEPLKVIEPGEGNAEKKPESSGEALTKDASDYEILRPGVAEREVAESKEIENLISEKEISHKSEPEANVSEVSEWKVEPEQKTEAHTKEDEPPNTESFENNSEAKESKTRKEQVVPIPEPKAYEEETLVESGKYADTAKVAMADELTNPLFNSTQNNVEPLIVTSPESSEMSNGHSQLHAEIEVLKQQLNEKDILNKKLQESVSATGDLQNRLASVERERDEANEKLNGFLSKISSMKNVFVNYKACQEELAGTLKEVEALKQELSSRSQELADKDKELALLKNDPSAVDQLNHELKSLDEENQKLREALAKVNSEAADTNNECDRLSLQLLTLRRELLEKEDTFLDEKYALENEVSRLNKRLNDKITQNRELEQVQEEAKMEVQNLNALIEQHKTHASSKDEQISALQAAAEQTAAEHSTQVDELEQRIAAKSAEVSLLVELLEKEKEALATSQAEVAAKVSAIEALEHENERIKQLEEEVHTKQLIIGKLRHEAIILNEHLTKSLGMLKQQLGDDNSIDKDLVSNVLISFLQIPRGDTKKFEALLLISALLGWDETRRVQAGLSNSNSRERPARLNFISLWTDFLEKESTKST